MIPSRRGHKPTESGYDAPADADVTGHGRYSPRAAAEVETAAGAESAAENQGAVAVDDEEVEGHGRRLPTVIDDDETEGHGKRLPPVTTDESDLEGHGRYVPVASDDVEGQAKRGVIDDGPHLAKAQPGGGERP